MAKYKRGDVTVDAEQWFPEMGAMQGRHGVWIRGRSVHPESGLGQLSRLVGINFLTPVGFDVPVGKSRRQLRAGDWIVTGPRGGQRVVPATRFADEYQLAEDA